MYKACVFMFFSSVNVTLHAVIRGLIGLNILTRIQWQKGPISLWSHGPRKKNASNISNDLI